MLNRHHKFFIIVLPEPFQRTKHIEKYKRRLGMHVTGANINGKIWYFVAQGVDVEVIEDKSQQITLNLKIQEPEY